MSYVLDCVPYIHMPLGTSRKILSEVSSEQVEIISCSTMSLWQYAVLIVCSRPNLDYVCTQVGLCRHLRPDHDEFPSVPPLRIPSLHVLWTLIPRVGDLFRTHVCLVLHGWQVWLGRLQTDPSGRVHNIRLVRYCARVPLAIVKLRRVLGELGLENLFHQLNHNGCIIYYWCQSVCLPHTGAVFPRQMWSLSP